MNDIAVNFGPAAALAAITLPIALAIKAIVDSRARAKLFASNTSQELIRAILMAEEESRRLGALRWGIVLTSLGAGLALIEGFGWNWEEGSAGVFAVLLIATGAGNLGFFAVAQVIRSQARRGSSE